jgi:hypothetical protein
MERRRKELRKRDLSGGCRDQPYFPENVLVASSETPHDIQRPLCDLQR